MFWGLLIRLAARASWTDVEAVLEQRVSDTTLRARRDEWTEAGVFDRLCAEALAAFDRIVGLDLSDVCVDGSTHKAPCGGDPAAKTCGSYGIDDIARTPKRRPEAARGRPKAEPLGLHWIVERANSWLSNYGQLRRNTDRKPPSRHAALHIATTILITAKHIDWKTRWNPT